MAIRTSRVVRPLVHGLFISYLLVMLSLPVVRAYLEYRAFSPVSSLHLALGEICGVNDSHHNSCPKNHDNENCDCHKYQPQHETGLITKQNARDWLYPNTYRTRLFHNERLYHLLAQRILPGTTGDIFRPPASYSISS
ncbi:MAG: hypothetical protein OEZ36_00395 [Spirochaetota bacterium]|nr:hypothetical protein [Spirochaetota bacterium]